MRVNMKNRKHNQMGVSIISMLIAMVISSTIILASFSLFQRITKSSIELSESAQYEGDLSILLHLIQIEVQSAGYRMNDNDQIFIEQIGGQFQVYWRYSELGGAPYTCLGLIETSVTEGSKKHTELYFMTPSDECTKDGTLRAMKWDVLTQKIARFENTNQSIFEYITLSDSQCSAFMVGDNSKSHKTLNISINTTVENITREMSICLINL